MAKSKKVEKADKTPVPLPEEKTAEGPVKGTEPDVLWLFRTAKNMITGPFSRTQAQEVLTAGKLHLQDEICPANGYWIYLHEKEEVFKMLGVPVPRTVSGTEEDITETETQTETKTEIIMPKADMTLPVASAPQEDGNTRAVNSTTLTAILKAQEAKHKSKFFSQPGTHAPGLMRQRTFILASFEKANYWRMFIWITILLAIGSLLLLFLLLN